MSMDPKAQQAAVDAFFKQSRHAQIEDLEKQVQGQLIGAANDKPWLSITAVEWLMLRILIASSQRIESLTGWLVVLTIVLAVLTAVLAVGEIRHLIGI
jgi:hypothetical protein